MSSCHSDPQTSEIEDDYMNAISHNTYQLANQPILTNTLERPLVPPLFPPFPPPPFDPKLLQIFPGISGGPPNPTPGDINPHPLLIPPFPPPPLDPNNPIFLPLSEQIGRNTPPESTNKPVSSPETLIRPPFLDQINRPQIQTPDHGNFSPLKPPEIRPQAPDQSAHPSFLPLAQPNQPQFQPPDFPPRFPTPDPMGRPPPSQFESNRPPFQPPNHFQGGGEQNSPHFQTRSDLPIRPDQPLFQGSEMPPNLPPFMPPEIPNRPHFQAPDFPNQRPPLPPFEHETQPNPPPEPPIRTQFEPLGQPNQSTFQPSDLQSRFQAPNQGNQTHFRGIPDLQNRPPIPPLSDPNLPPNHPHFLPPDSRSRPHFMPSGPPSRPPFQPPSEQSDHDPMFRIPSGHNFQLTSESKVETELQKCDPNNVPHFASPEAGNQPIFPPNLPRFSTPPGPPPFTSPPTQSIPDRFRVPEKHFPEHLPDHRETDPMASPTSDPNVESNEFTPPGQPILPKDLPQNNQRPPEPPWKPPPPFQQPQFGHPRSIQEHTLSPSNERTPERNEMTPEQHQHDHTPPEQIGSPARHIDHRPPFDMGPDRPMNHSHRMPFDHPDEMEYEHEMEPNFHEPPYHPMPHQRMEQPFTRPPYHRHRMFGPPPREPFYPPFHMRHPMRRPRPPQMQMGHIPFGPVWSEHMTVDGKTYFHNHVTSQSVWEGEPPQNMFQPPGQMELEPEIEIEVEKKVEVIQPKEEPEQPVTTKPINSTPVPGTEWCVVWTNDNKVFFFNPVQNKSLWLIPTELKEHPIARKLIERNPDLPEPETAPVENVPKRAKIEPVVTIEEEKSSNGDSDIEILKDVEIVLQQPIKKQSKKSKDSKTDPMVSEAEAKMLRSTKPLEIRIAEYKEMLLQRGVSAFSTWEKEQPKVAFDPRYILLTAKERKSVFEQFTQERIHEEKREKNLKLKQKREKFFSLLQDAKVGPKSSFHEFMLKWSKEPRFKEIERLKERESLFIEFQTNLKKKSKTQTKSQSYETAPEVKQISDEKGSKQNRIQASLREREREVYESRRNQERDLEDQRSIYKRDEAKTQYKSLLTEMVKDARTNFKSFEKALRENPGNDDLYESLSRDERQIQFENHQDHLQNRKRLQFQACIDECSEIDYATGWKKARKLLKQDPRLEAVGSSESKQESEYVRYMESKSKRAREAFVQLLRETKLITYKTKQSIETNPKGMKEIHDLLSNDRRYLDLDCVSQDRFQMVLNYIDELSVRGTPPPPTATSPNRARLK